MLFRSRNRLLAPTLQRLLCGRTARSCARQAFSAHWRLNPTGARPPIQKSPRPSRRELRNNIGWVYGPVVLSTDHKNKLLSVRLKSSSGRMLQLVSTHSRRLNVDVHRHSAGMQIRFLSVSVLFYWVPWPLLGVAMIWQHFGMPTQSRGHGTPFCL